MFNALFTTTNKRTNSTEVPSMTGAAAIAIELLDSTSLMNPSIRIVQSGNPVSYNYVYISEFNRYYFINDWTSDHGQWIASLSCDVLATYKSSVIAAQEYVMRSASSFDGSIIDTAYPATVDRDFQRMIPRSSYDSQTEYYPLQQGKSYIVGITGQVSNLALTNEQIALYNKCQMGSTSYYWLSEGELWALIKYLLSGTALQNMWQISDISENLQKGIINPLQYIQSITMVPFDRVKDQAYDQTTGTATLKVFYGYFELNVNDLLGSASQEWFELWQVEKIKELNCYFHLTPHPYAATRGKYMNFSPWIEYQMTFEPFGNFVLDPKNMEDAVGLKCQLEIEGIDGIGVLKIFPMEEIETPGGGSTVQVNPRRLVYYGQAQVGVPVSIAQITQDYVKRIGGDVSGALGMAGAAVGMGASIATANVPGAIASGIGIANAAASMIGNAVDSMIPNVSTKGANGNAYSFTVDGPWLYNICTYPVDDDNEQLGRPLCQQVTLSTLSGYCLCRDADVKISGATENEIDAVKAYMNGGFFIE